MFRVQSLILLSKERQVSIICWSLLVESVFEYTLIDCGTVSIRNGAFKITNGSLIQYHEAHLNVFLILSINPVRMFDLSTH